MKFKRAKSVGEAEVWVSSVVGANWSHHFCLRTKLPANLHVFLLPSSLSDISGLGLGKCSRIHSLSCHSVTLASSIWTTLSFHCPRSASLKRSYPSPHDFLSPYSALFTSVFLPATTLTTHVICLFSTPLLE